MTQRVYAVLLAGGEGKRLWPLSRSEKPKGFLRIADHKPLISCAIDGLRGFVDKKHTLIVINKSQKSLLKGLAKGIPDKNILLEPLKKNTAAAVGLAATRLSADDIMVVLPTDAIIKNRSAFLSAIKRAVSFVAKQKDAICCVGIKPREAKTGYGYIKLGFEKAKGVYLAGKFIEKPSREKAEEMLRKGNFLWNAGMFVMKAETILSSMRKYAPRLYRALMAIKVSGNIARAYSLMKNVSIDYQVMERAKNLYCVKGNFCWNDLGSWLSVADMEGAPRDKKGNFCFGPVKHEHTSRSIMYNATKDTMLVSGLRNMIAVHASGKTLICDKKDAENVKEIATFFTDKA